MNALDQYLLLRIFAPVSAWWGRLTGARVSDQVRALCPGILLLLGLRLAFREINAYTVIAPLIFGVFTWTTWLSAPQSDRVPNPWSQDVWYLRRLWLLALPFDVVPLIVPPPINSPPQMYLWLGLAFDLLVISTLYIRGCPAPPPKRERQPSGAPMLRA